MRPEIHRSLPSAQFVLFYAILFFGIHYLRSHGKSLPIIPAALIALPGAALLVWKFNKEEN